MYTQALRSAARSGSSRLLVNVVALLCSGMALTQALTQADGTIVDSRPCAPPENSTYERYLAQQKALLEEEARAARAEGFTIDYVADLKRWVLDREEFERRQRFTDYECRRITYLSDGLRVTGFIWKPRQTEGRRLPLVIVNRGGNPNLALLTPQSFFYPYVRNGFVVIGSQYRGADGGEGQDEYGGADVNDVLNVFPLARSLGDVDMNNVFMHGHSRGGMQTLLAVKRGAPVNAVAVTGVLADLSAAANERPGVADRVWGRLIPGYAEGKEALLRERSAVAFAGDIGVPVMLLHGGADWRADAGSQSLALAGTLQRLGKTYELHIYAGDDHAITLNRLDRERHIVEWFRKYMK